MIQGKPFGASIYLLRSDKPSQVMMMMMRTTKLQNFQVFYTNPQSLVYTPSKPYQIMNTWCGDPLRLYMLQGVHKIMKDNNLINQTTEVGDYLMKNLREIQNKGKINNVRGIGLCIGFDMPNKESAWSFYRNMLNRGVHVGIARENVVQLRPALIFEKKHADIFLESVNALL